MKPQAYIVTTQRTCEGAGTVVLGYATGDQQEIKDFYDDQKMYSIDLTPIAELPQDSRHIAREDLCKRRELLAEKRDLEARLGRVKGDLRVQLGHNVIVNFTRELCRQ